MRTLSLQERYQFIRRYHNAVDRLLDVLDDRLENLYIASNPGVYDAILRLIQEVTQHLAYGVMTIRRNDG